MRAALLLFAFTAACARDLHATSTQTTNTQAAPPANSAQATPRSAPDSDDRGAHVQPATANALTMAVGERAFEIVASPESISLANLKIIAADKADTRESLADRTRIAGYPIIGSTHALDRTQAQAAVKAFADSKNYDPDRRMRCAVERIIGFRFVRDEHHVDIALTDPCALAMWSFERNDTNNEWAAPFDRALAQQLVQLANAQ